MSDSRPTYSKPQITKYFDRLTIPHNERVYDVKSLNPEDALSYLALLQKLHLANIPFENLSIHYSTHRQVSIHAQELFRKIIDDNNGRGGYCMENNLLFGTLMHSLGFNLYSGGGRVLAQGGVWTGFGHMVNLVTIDDLKYLVDVGFGSDSPVRPQPLVSGTVLPHMAPGSTRLQWRNITPNTDPNQRLWICEYRRTDDSDWETKYCFSELEFLPQDYNVMNYYTSTNPRSIFSKTIMVETKILRDNELVGNQILLGNNLKWRVHGQKEKEIVLNSEAERLQALEEHWGIKLGQPERDGIRGLSTEL